QAQVVLRPSCSKQSCVTIFHAPRPWAAQGVRWRRCHVAVCVSGTAVARSRRRTCRGAFRAPRPNRVRSRPGSLRAVLGLILNQECPLADSPACERASSASLFPEAKGRLGGQWRCWCEGTDTADGRTARWPHGGGGCKPGEKTTSSMPL